MRLPQLTLLLFLFLTTGRMLTAAVDTSLLPAPAARPVDFVEEIRPLLESACHSCHGEEKQKGGLRLDLKAAALRGGDFGAAIIAGNSAGSPLVHMIAGLIEDQIMPAKGARLTPEQVGLVRAWIDQGARWPDGIDTAREIDPLDFWSLKPLRPQPVPALDPEDASRAGNPIDAFILAKLREKHLAPSHEAGRRTLIRRVYFDLIGLPPSPKEVETFVANEDPAAYTRMVDRLLASNHYGERWARHWLDVVHYGDTHGYDKDQPRPNAWPYRDYLIRAFNEDRPYSRFVREQIAGDILYPDTVDGIVGTGFISAGPWDLIGHAEVPESKIDGKVARNLDRDDMVSNTMNTFLSLTVQCARCHNHKFDPVTQEDYYSLQAVFAALDRADREYDADPALARERAGLTTRRRELEEQQTAMEARIRELGGEDLARLEQEIKTLAQAGTSESAAFGYHSAIEQKPGVVKWVQVDLGQPKPIARLSYVACKDDFNNIGPGFGFPVRYKIEASDDPTFGTGVVTLLDRTTEDVPNPGITPQFADAPPGLKARYVRVTATKLAPRQNDYIFALSELLLHDPQNLNLAPGSDVTAHDSIEAPVRWAKKNLVDGHYPGATTNATQLARTEALTREREALLHRVVDEPTRARSTRLHQTLAAVRARIAKLPPRLKVYAGTVYQGSGAFCGTGGKPRTIHVLHRGDVQNTGKEAAPGSVPIIRSVPARFDLPEGAPEGERRVRLAEWIVHRENPLVWRSIVNRIWQYHFGKGIVDSPNDFGRMGSRPTHPELLDWLALEFRDGGQSIKNLHRLILNSSIYRQSAGAHPGNERIDADNQYLWRMNRRRLTAEEIRDTALSAAGKLSGKMYGPGFQDFVIEKPEHSPHYQYHLHDPKDPQTHRRSVYRFLVRSQQSPFMTTLDCADPSQMVARRNETLTALQALALLNNRFILTMSDYFAQRVEAAAPTPEARIRETFRIALSRQPTTGELAGLMAFNSEHGLANTCRLILNLNEFVFID